MNEVTQQTHNEPDDFAIVKIRILNPVFDHVEMNDAIAALVRIQNRMIAKNIWAAKSPLEKGKCKLSEMLDD